MKLVLALLLVLSACGAPADEAVRGDTAGAKLERAARTAGLVADPARINPVGLFQTETDRVCMVRDGRAYRIGVSIDYGEGQGCTARGTARGAGSLTLDFSGGCTFSASIDAERLTFPATLPAACDRLCSGRASLAALAADRLSASPAEAASLRAANGRLLCGA